MEIIACITLFVCSCYLYSLNSKSYSNYFNFAEKLKNNLTVVNSLDDLKYLPDGSPVYVSGEFKIIGKINDTVLNMTFEDTIAVDRDVSMYQIEERIPNQENRRESLYNTNNHNDEKSLESNEQVKNKMRKSSPNNEQTSYQSVNNYPNQQQVIKKKTYIWSDKYQEGRGNPRFPFKSQRFLAAGVNIGPFKFDSDFISKNFKLNQVFSKYILTRAEVESMPLSWQSSNFVIDRKIPKTFIDDFWSRKLKTIENGDLLIFDKMQKDTVGDLKISYSKNSAKYATVMGAKFGDTIVPNFDEGYTFLFAELKMVPRPEIHSKIESDAISHFWAMNILIIILFFGGCYLVFNYLK